MLDPVLYEELHFRLVLYRLAGRNGLLVLLLALLGVIAAAGAGEPPKNTCPCCRSIPGLAWQITCTAPWC